MVKRTLRYVLILVIGWVVIHYVSVKYSFNDLKEYTTILARASAMVFTLMGIWIAFLYPNALSRIIDPNKDTVDDFSESLQATKRLEAIVGSVLKSATVVLCLMLVFLIKMILFGTPLYKANAELFKHAVLSIIVFITYLQVEAIGHVIFANIMFINDIHRKREERQANADI